MSGVYGDFLSSFLELLDVIEVWTLEDKSDLRYINGAFIPGKGDSIKRRKYTSGNTGLDIVGSDSIYTFTQNDKIIYVGDYLSIPGSPYIWRVTNVQSYNRAADFIVCNIERVTGTTPENNGELKIKEAQF